MHSNDMPTANLKANPINDRIYGETVADAGLTESVRLHGVIESIVIKRDFTIVSGHRRWAAARGAGLESVPVRYVEFENAEDEREAIIEYNRQREKTFTQRMNEADELRDIERERARQRQATSTGGNNPQLVDICPQAGKTRDAIASQVGIGSGRTYDRARAVWERAKAGEEEAKALVDSIDRGDTTISAAYRDVRRPANIALLHTGDEESYTPEEYIEAARLVMGSIDLDPASNDLAQKTIQAATFYTVHDDGLTKPWAGNVWLNPPYTARVINLFVGKLCQHFNAGEVTSAVLLTNNNTDTAWWHEAMQSAAAVCFTAGRVNFYKPDGGKSSPTNGQTFFYFGRDMDAFKREFARHGLIMVRG